MLYAIQFANHAWGAATGYVTRTYEIVRQITKQRRRDQPSRPRNLHRTNFPIACPASTPSSIPSPVSAQSMEELLSNRKRKPDELLSPMSRIKRQDHGYNKSSPWSQDVWAQQLATNVDIKLKNATNKHYKKWNRRQPTRKSYTLHGIRYQRSPSPKIMKPYRASLHPRRPDHFEEAYNNLYNSNTIERFYTPRRSSTPEEFLTPDESRTSRGVSHAPEDPPIDEDVLQTSNFAFVQPKELGETIVDSKDEPDEKAEEEEEESDWDEQGEIEHRKMLRGLAESYDEEGFRVPIDGIISPESREWNREHGRELFERAALEQQTPSKPPKYGSPLSLITSPKLVTSPRQIAPGAIVTDDTAGPIPKDAKQDSPSSSKTTFKTEVSATRVDETEDSETPQTPPKDTLSTKNDQAITNGDTFGIKIEDQVGAKTLQTLPGTPFLDTSAITNGHASIIKHEDGEETLITALPLLSLEDLSLETPKPNRTPKSGSLKLEKSVRTTRYQERLAQIEAAKNAYPLVSLSKKWDDKVRHAVNHGHGRFEATMFNKCVPEYSNDPSARSLWLDDAVINDYVAMIAKHGSKDDRKDQVRSVAALSSFFFTKISDSRVNYSSCAGMLRRAGIQGKKLLDCEKVFIPINRSYHWTIAVIEPKIPEGLTYKDHKRKVTVYNSMGSSGGHAVAEIIMKWIQNELGPSFKEEEWDVNPAGVSPQQRNTDDCGVFACTTARQIMLKKYEDIGERYKEVDIRGMRKRIVAELVNGDLLNKEESSQ